jgi:hypothetical protein
MSSSSVSRDTELQNMPTGSTEEDRFYTTRSQTPTETTSTLSSSPDENLLVRSQRFSRPIAAFDRLSQEVREGAEFEARDLWPLTFRALVYYTRFGTSFLPRTLFLVFYILHAISRAAMAPAIFIVIIMQAFDEKKCSDMLFFAYALLFLYVATSTITVTEKCRPQFSKLFFFFNFVQFLAEICAVSWVIVWYNNVDNAIYKLCASSGISAVAANWIFLTGFFYLFYVCIATVHVIIFVRFTLKKRREIEMRERISQQNPLDFGVRILAPFQDNTEHQADGLLIASDSENDSHSCSGENLSEKLSEANSASKESSSSDISDSTPVCAICADVLFAKKKTVSVAVELACSHCFHSDCVRLHFANQMATGLPRSCPMCQKKIGFNS